MSMTEKLKDNPCTFEEALSKLESIVDSMESGDIPLQDLITKFEEGNALLKYCNKQLSQAELKIEKLKENTDNQFENFETKDE